MFETDEFELWNLAPDSNAVFGAQKIFNVLGRLKNPERIRKATYSINGCSEKPIFFRHLGKHSARLVCEGDFNIDTIPIEILRPLNQITLRLYLDHECKMYRINFSASVVSEIVPQHKLDLSTAKYPQEVGQIVDGKWQWRRDESSEPCLEILKQDSGHDRIILFGRHDWTSGYVITARLCVTAWTHITHNVGLLFKWNPHLQGDGTCLPIQWTTGLGYYYSLSKGLRIRFGRNVHFDYNGNKQGDFVLKEKPLSAYYYVKGKIIKHYRWFFKLIRVNSPFTYDPLSQIIPGRKYLFRLLVHPEKYTLTVWEEGKNEPSPQLVVKKPVEILPSGSVGIIAYNCGVRVYDFEVSPV